MVITNSRFLEEDEFSGLELKIDYKFEISGTGVLYKINGDGWIFDKELYDLIKNKADTELDRNFRFLNLAAEHHFKYQFFSDYKYSFVTKGLWKPEQNNTETEGSGLLILDGLVASYVDMEKEVHELMGLEF